MPHPYDPTVRDFVVWTLNVYDFTTGSWHSHVVMWIECPDVHAGCKILESNLSPFAESAALVQSLGYPCGSYALLESLIYEYDRAGNWRPWKPSAPISRREWWVPCDPPPPPLVS